MKAKYQSTCHNCVKAIVQGDSIRMDFDNRNDKWRAVHYDCANLRELPDPSDRYPVVSLHQLIEEGYGRG